MLDELIRLTTPPKLEPDEFTVAHYLERQEELGQAIPRNTAYNHLRKLVSEGILTVRKVIHDGKEWNAYRFVDGHES
jgi:hypothetical protein